MTDSLVGRWQGARGLTARDRMLPVPVSDAPVTDAASSGAGYALPLTGGRIRA